VQAAQLSFRGGSGRRFGLDGPPGVKVWIQERDAPGARLLDEGEIDEFMIHVIFRFIGEGIPLIAPGRRTVSLKLISLTKFTDGVVKLH